MIRRAVDAMTRPSVAMLTVLTGMSGAVLAVSINLAAGLVAALVLGMLSAAMTSEGQR